MMLHDGIVEGILVGSDITIDLLHVPWRTTHDHVERSFCGKCRSHDLPFHFRLVVLPVLLKDRIRVYCLTFIDKFSAIPVLHRFWNFIQLCSPRRSLITNAHLGPRWDVLFWHFH